ncbi:uncharacterized protein VTP21DRAFT_492 [Calcarisporiella thermophila]|uniref:uncharacterized protein n=1 Tax=Calcarisporiella thermophila TaxID=911321 RepID=UPI00374313AD
MPQRPLKAGILGGTGTVGQRFVLLISEHPYLRLHAIGASPKSAGKTYAEATRWKLSCPIPENARSLIVRPCVPSEFSECDIVFSGLDADVAGDIEMAFLKADLVVFSNAKNYRRDPLVPLVVPVVNAPHFDIVPQQRSAYSLQKGFLVTNANCSTTGLVAALKPLQDAFGPLSHVVVHTMQAISGAGYPGVASLDIMDNVVPHIGGEEEKMEWETLKILGGCGAEGFVPLSETKVSASCNRVPVIDGHLECVSIKFAKRPPPSSQQIMEVLRNYVPEAQKLGCPSAPKQCIKVFEDVDRPQPRLDRDLGAGYTVSVGRVRECPVLDVKFVLLAHNTVLGAAGSSILNAEVAVAKGLIG